MTTSMNQQLETSLSQRLKTETSTEHDRMEQLMEQAKVFENQSNYARFTLSQYYFQKDVEHLYAHPDVVQIIPDLDVRGRSDAALLDLKDLGLEPQSTSIATDGISFPQALGWIYVSEGSTLGAAFLFKAAQHQFGFTADFAARNLAAYPEGRAVVWKRFKQAMDDANFSQEQQDQVIEGAMQGFSRFGQLLADLEQLK